MTYIKYILCCVWFVYVACDASDLPEIDSDTNTYNNSVFGDNELWNGLFEQCGKRTTFRCVENKVFGYLENTLDSDFHVTDNIYFVKNENKYSEEVNTVSERVGRSENFEENEEFSEFINRVESVEGLQEGDESGSVPENKTANIEDVTDVLYNRAVKYLVTHDLDVNLPSAVLKISPRGFDEDGGALVKFNVLPLPNKPEQGRFLHKIINKIFKKKLMSSFLAAMLIMKLVKIKAMFLLPVLLGVGTAKKLLLKILLFLFPALAHLFKLCAYYHHHHAKYHHHHHQVSHHHHHIPVPVYTPTHHSTVGEYPAPYSYGGDTTAPGGPYIHSRTDSPITDLASWGIGDYPSSWDDPRLTRTTDAASIKYNNYQAQVQAQAQAQARPQPQQIQNMQYAQTQNEIKLNQKLFNGNIGIPNKVGLQPGAQQLYYAKPGYLQVQAVTPRVQPANSDYDPFYSPILQKLDSVFLQLGFTDEGCRERMVCSMYKSPQRYSPHSNLISTELSRDPSELRKPVSMNPAVIRFFRYVQAARDGQELKDCLKIYAACGLATE